MELKYELEKLKKHLGTDSAEFDKQLAVIHQHFTSDEDKEFIHQYMKDSANELIAGTDALIKDVTLRMQLEDVAKIVSLSYIAENYFKKTRQWLYQRINGSLVNKKPARFTDAELETLNYALRDISNKIGSINVSM